MVSLPSSEDTGSSLGWGVAREAFRSAEALTSCCRLAPSRRLKSLLRLEAPTSHHKLPHQPTPAKDSRVLIPFLILVGETPCSRPRPSLRRPPASASASMPRATATTPAFCATTCKSPPTNWLSLSLPPAMNCSASACSASPLDTPPSTSSSASTPPGSTLTTSGTSDQPHRAIANARVTLSCGDPQRNKNYRAALFGARKSEAVEARACARYALSEQPASSAALSAPLRVLRQVAGRLQALVRQRTRLINQLHH